MTNRSSADADCEHHEINSISDDDATGTNDKKDCEKRLSAIHALEAKAVAKASAAADNRFIPSASLMNSNDPYAIIGQVDGLADLSDYDENESVYVGTSVPISAGGCLEIPIQVATPGSIVHYSVENKKYDFAFSITAERDHTITLVKIRGSMRVVVTDLLPENF